MHDHYTVTSTESDRQYVRTVIAANRRDAKHTPRALPQRHGDSGRRGPRGLNIDHGTSVV